VWLYRTGARFPARRGKWPLTEMITTSLSSWHSS
jgi:hypothetical protein